MDRFFSKLDLRDIKIDPENSRFLPDEEQGEEPAAVEAEASTALEDAACEETQESDEADPDESDDQPPVAASAPPAEAVVTERAVYIDIDVAAGPVNNEVLKVSARSRPSAAAGAIAGVVRELGRAEVQAIGAGATNQAIKAVAIARDYLRESDIDAVCLPEFIDITIDDEDRTAVRLVVEPR